MQALTFFIEFDNALAKSLVLIFAVDENVGDDCKENTNHGKECEKQNDDEIETDTPRWYATLSTPR